MFLSYDEYVDSVRYTDFSSKSDSSLDSYDTDAINNSILNILLTTKGTIPFNYDFGAGLLTFVFETINVSVLTNEINRVLDEVEFYENRIIIDRNSVELNIDSDIQTIDLYLPYSIRSTGGNGEFYKRMAVR